MAGKIRSLLSAFVSVAIFLLGRSLCNQHCGSMTITTIIVLRYRVIKLAEHEREQVELTAIAITKYYVAAYFDLVIVNLRVQRTP